MLITAQQSTVKQDLLARNIQRGRDHGLPDFNTLNVAMNLSQKTFDWLNFAKS
jgi:hypothetical protein